MDCEKFCGDIFKYFTHGIVFAVLMFFLSFAWGFLFAILVIFGAIIGIIVGLALLVFIVGFANLLITDFLWFSVKSSWVDMFFHGLVLLPAVFITDVFISYPLNMMFPGFSTLVVVFIVESFVNGVIGKTIAKGWKEETLITTSELENDLNNLDTQDLYEKLRSEYVMRWGAVSGIDLLNKEIRAYTRHGVSFDEAVRKIMKRRHV